MRDYRDAKAMAHTLREGLKAQSVNLTHSAVLELIARVLGFKDWQVLAARIEADRSVSRPIEPPPAAAPAPEAAPSTFYCSFCGKSQHEVAKLIAGPSGVFICDECTGLCDDIVSEQAPETYVQAQQALAGKTTEELVVIRAKVRSSVARARQALNAIRAAASDAGPPAPGAEPERSNPQRQMILRKSPQERAAYIAEAEERILGIQRVGETAAALLAERGVSLGPPSDRFS